jgi:hypothetical protein
VRDRNLSPILLIGCVLVTAVGVILVVANGGESQPDVSQAPSERDGSGATLPADAPDDREGQASDGTPVAPAGVPGVVRVQRGYPFIWPADGSVTTAMGPSHPAGIEIGLESAGESAIRAAASGVVTFAGPAFQEDIGIQIVIDHGGALRTVYGRLERVVVSRGQTVAQGELIGIGGGIGVATSRNLYFEVNHGGSQINPIELLPARPDSAPSTTVIECPRELISVESGAPLRLDFSETLDPNAILARVDVGELSVSPNAAPVRASLSGAAVLFETAPSVVNSGESVYTLIVEARLGGERERYACTVVVLTRTVVPSFFAAPTEPSPPTPAEVASPAAASTEVPAQTPTPTPTPPPSPTPTKTPFPFSP